MTLTPANVSALWAFMSRTYGSTVVDKRNAPEMKLAAKFLPTPGFLDHYATTIGRRIYLPFIPGSTDTGWSLNSQAAVCAHEHTHCDQLNRDGFRFMLGYVTSPAKRAAYEVEAYRTTLEMQWFLTGTIGDPDGIADRLVNYGCRAADVETSRKTLEQSAVVVRQGVVVTPAALWAIGFLRRLGEVAA